MKGRASCLLDIGFLQGQPPLLNVCRLTFFEAVLLEELGHTLVKCFPVGSSCTINPVKGPTTPAPATWPLCSVASAVTPSYFTHALPPSWSGTCRPPVLLAGDRCSMLDQCQPFHHLRRSSPYSFSPEIQPVFPRVSFLVKNKCYYIPGSRLPWVDLVRL